MPSTRSLELNPDSLDLGLPVYSLECGLARLVSKKYLQRDVIGSGPGPVKVLHLPKNITSQMNTTVRALRELGEDARGMARLRVVSDSEYIEPTLPGSRSEPIQWCLGQVPNSIAYLKAIAWADVVHWHYGPGAILALDLLWARRLGKPGIVEFWGSDIRIPEIEARDNPYYRALAFGGANSRIRARVQRTISHLRQEAFSLSGVAVTVPSPSLEDYLLPSLFDRRYSVRQRVWIDDYVPRFPNPESREPIIVHSPTRQHLKGTAFVEAAIRGLSGKRRFKYERVENMPHKLARSIMQDCDIFVDQLVLGDHGLAAIEAMALGKPVVCYLKPSVHERLPKDLPIMSATPDTLPEVLERLLADGTMRNELGRKGRQYVQHHHDARNVAVQLRDIYRELIGTRRGNAV